VYGRRPYSYLARPHSVGIMRRRHHANAMMRLDTIVSHHEKMYACNPRMLLLS